MGGCAPSKMPTGEQLPKPKNSRLSFSSNGSAASGKPPPASLNASDTRIKHLAVADDNYELVQGGRLVEPVSVNGNGVAVALDVMRDAGSQTLTSAPPDISVSRPKPFLPVFSPRTGSKSTAPLATIETSSELGTPTPMEENKAFIRPAYGGASLLPQPGKQRPLITSGLPPPRFAFTPKGPSFPSPSPVTTPLAASTVPELPPKPGKAVRPVGLSPRTPPSSLTSGRGVTDNVLISTSSISSFSLKTPGKGAESNGDLPKPGSVISSARSAGRESAGLESVRASSSASSTPRSVDLSNSAGRLPRLGLGSTGDYKLDSVTEAPALTKPSIPVPGSRGGIRAPTSAGLPARGPLATQPTIRPTLPLYEPPAKPLRKSPQSQSGMNGTASPYQEPSLDSEEVVVPVTYTTHVNQLRFSPKESSQQKMASKRAPGQHTAKYTSDEFETGSDIIEKGDDDSIFSEREALAQMPKTYRVKESVLDEMLGSLRDVKDIAAELLKLHESNDKILQNGHREGTNEIYAMQNGTSDAIPLKKYRLDAMLLPPNDTTLNSPEAARELILELQNAVRVLYARAT